MPNGPNQYSGVNSQGNSYTVTDTGYFYNNENGSHYANERNHIHYQDRSTDTQYHYNKASDTYSSGTHYFKTNERSNK
ncbi:unnamed protein product [Oikopleura dioica]|uniref:Uncharacterized protein n=1 Tax=Oikopleura dioica TaxID=34765 RepID=E4X0A0_OIKDI|nr:unnamed protein product [Oikopleura dioica]